MSNSVNLFELIAVAIIFNVQHRSARVNLRVGLLLDRILVSSHSSVPSATVRRPTLKPKKPKNLKTFLKTESIISVGEQPVKGRCK